MAFAKLRERRKTIVLFGAFPIREVKSMFDKFCLILAVIGCLNWGLVGLFSFDLVAWLFGGSGEILSRIVYTVIALAGVWCISLLFRPDNEHVAITD